MEIELIKKFTTQFGGYLDADKNIQEQLSYDVDEDGIY